MTFTRQPSTFKKMAPEEIAWVAGILEGEGYFGVRRTRYNQVDITVNMTDEDVIRRLAELTGVGKVYGPYPGVNKPRWDWKVQKFNDCIDLAKTVLPWMSVRRTEQIQALLESAE